MAKDFNDFKAGLQEIHLQLISQTINDLKIKTKLPNDEESVRDFINSIAAMNIVLTLELLEAYHDWVSR